MSDMIQEYQAEALILAYKLNKIKQYINSRIKTVDPITRNEYNVILNIIKKYDYVNADWTLDEPLVEISKEEV